MSRNAGQVSDCLRIITHQLSQDICNAVLNVCVMRLYNITNLFFKYTCEYVRT